MIHCTKHFLAPSGAQGVTMSETSLSKALQIHLSISGLSILSMPSLSFCTLSAPSKSLKHLVLFPIKGVFWFEF